MICENVIFMSMKKKSSMFANMSTGQYNTTKIDRATVCKESHQNILFICLCTINIWMDDPLWNQFHPFTKYELSQSIAMNLHIYKKNLFCITEYSGSNIIFTLKLSCQNIIICQPMIDYSFDVVLSNYKITTLLTQ